jgi:uncharacterized phosphatase
MEILITRHGQTDWNTLGKLQGQTDIELNEVGINQAKETAKLIENEQIDLIITSPLNRARKTAELINKNINAPIIEDARLMERRYGKLEGFTKERREKLKEENPEIDFLWNYNKNVDFKNVETMHDFCKRIYEFLNETVKKYEDKKVLLVTHGGVSVPIQYYFMKIPLEKLVDRQNIKGLGNCEVIKFNI